ncbi:hypothetical protein MMC14_004805 [Varicellaria rhodocarpa]|nr:hypothetical protein [Varicellaria rhodocarpa]
MAPPPGYFTILYFASASTHTRKTTEYLPAPLPLCQLFEKLEARYPGMKRKVLGSCAVTVNLEYVDIEEDGKEEGGNEEEEKEEGKKRKKGLVIKEGDEVGIIPPVSSG